jgi:tRNA modification GTPase
VVFDGAVGPGVDAAAALVDADSIVVVNKSDIAHLEAPVVVKGHEAIPISALTGAGLAALLHRVEAEVGRRWGLSGGIALTRVRHRQALERCAGSLTRIARQGGEAMMAETVAEDLRLAARELGRITGRVDVEEILGVIFQDFCIGK